MASFATISANGETTGRLAQPGRFAGAACICSKHVSSQAPSAVQAPFPDSPAFSPLQFKWGKTLPQLEHHHPPSTQEGAQVCSLAADCVSNGGCRLRQLYGHCRGCELVRRRGLLGTRAPFGRYGCRHRMPLQATNSTSGATIPPPPLMHLPRSNTPCCCCADGRSLDPGLRGRIARWQREASAATAQSG